MTSSPVQAELLRSYIKNREPRLLLFAFCGIFFTGAYLFMYGIPYPPALYIIPVFLLCIGVILIQQKYFYKSLARKSLADLAQNLERYVFLLQAGKAAYTLPWLTILFWPVNNEYVYSHLLGYFYVFSIITLYISSKPTFFRLFVFECGLHFVFSAFIAVLNYSRQEILYVLGPLTAFAVYAFITGHEFFKAARQDVENKQKLKEALLQAEKANRAKTEFIAIISHEIRTPMVGIMGMIDILDDTNLTSSQQEYLTVINQCSKSLLNTLNDLIDTAKMEAGTFTLAEENYACAELLENTVKVIAPLAEAKGISLVCKIDNSFPRQAYGDANRLRQICNNLLNNAVKFTETGSVTLQAQMKPDPKPVMRIEITDTGIGISSKDRKKLFRSFSQADSSISRQYGGSGLGLSISKTLVEMMGGKIGVASSKGKGSAFWLEIPYRETVSLHVQEDEKQELFERPLSLLLVEDNPINQKVVMRLLLKKGHNVLPVTNGADALAAVRQKSFDLILMDINLPREDGIETTRRIKALGSPASDIPVIALSAGLALGQEDACKKAGICDYIIKPFAPQELYALINRWARTGFDKAVNRDQTISLSQKMAGIREEMGEEYSRYILQNGISDLQRLLPLLQESFHTGPHSQTVKLAHEFKGVAGSVGLHSLYSLSSRLEMLSVEEMMVEGEVILIEMGLRIRQLEAVHTS